MNAKRHVTTSTIFGISSIETVVSKNPTHIWSVNAVPMYFGSPSSVTHDENCAEAATTLAPQITATSNSGHTLPPNKNPTSKQQLPLIAIATDVTTVRPTRSAIKPATTQPIAPDPITRNEPASRSEEHTSELQSRGLISMPV